VIDAADDAEPAAFAPPLASLSWSLPLCRPYCNKEGKDNRQ
jgi:hypothetical protein